MVNNFIQQQNLVHLWVISPLGYHHPPPLCLLAHYQQLSSNYVRLLHPDAHTNPWIAVDIFDQNMNLHHLHCANPITHIACGEYAHICIYLHLSTMIVIWLHANFPWSNIPDWTDGLIILNDKELFSWARCVGPGGLQEQSWEYRQRIQCTLCLNRFEINTTACHASIIWSCLIISSRLKHMRSSTWFQHAIGGIRFSVGDLCITERKSDMMHLKTPEHPQLIEWYFIV